MDRWYKKVISHFYGIGGPVDEYREQKVNKFGSVAYIILWIYLLISTFIATGFWNFSETALAFLVTGNLVVILALSMGAAIYVYRNKLDKQYFDNPLRQKKIYRYKAFGQGLYFGIATWLLAGLQNIWLDNKSFNLIFTWKEFIGHILMGTFFGALIYIFSLHRIDKKIEEH
ncbi:DUF3278 domain-containing protein [Convivina intestini]|uniref:Uncharacterized protein DUF3278 n=1 Tax=Convivina intestini TaxID=1505726 RepID=A0A2U1D6I5_9LACO|nr:DUF3278 domain-containing protein [Convivina intestini]PVY83152.1 uncharacterized protein DUF3278 [Convivina intestini]CAH1856285.1 hypothetical protein R077811_01225 [Convivina intestini]SDB95520.1 Protein of unknown function [Leuconostocaceae bacterium R-53105]